MYAFKCGKNLGGPLHYLGNVFLSQPDSSGHMRLDAEWVSTLLSIIQHSTRTKKYRRCIEPFSGCASFTTAAMEAGIAEQYIVNDSDKILILTLEYLKKHPDHVKENYALLEQKLYESTAKKAYFIQIIEAYNDAASNEEKALMLPFIINHSWSGMLFHDAKGDILYREGTFFQGKPLDIFLEEPSLSLKDFNEEVDRVSALFNRHPITFKSGDFFNVLTDISSDDFIALDPPYPENERSLIEKTGIYRELYPPVDLHNKLLALIKKMQDSGIHYYMSYGFYNPKFRNHVLLNDTQNPANYFRPLWHREHARIDRLEQLYFTSEFFIPPQLNRKIISAHQILEHGLDTTLEEAIARYHGIISD